MLPLTARADLDEACELETPPLPQLVPDGVFDAFGWCRSTTLSLRRPKDRWDPSTGLDLGRENPAGLVFVMHAECTFLPRELARLHAVGYGLREQWALAPYAIDDATDGLFERRATPRAIFWLAASSLRALFWGLHDWAHFHNHGPFEQRAWTELQCDASALAWLWRNRARVALGDEAWCELHGEVVSTTRVRSDEEGLFHDPSRLDAARLQAFGEAP